MSEKKTITLKSGAKLTYRVPNVIEQLQFFSQSGWYKDSSEDIYMKSMRAIEAARSFVEKVEGAESFDALLLDRTNLDGLIEFGWDIASVKVTETQKKP